MLLGREKEHLCDFAEERRSWCMLPAAVQNPDISHRDILSLSLLPASTQMLLLSHPRCIHLLLLSSATPTRRRGAADPPPSRRSIMHPRTAGTPPHSLLFSLNPQDSYAREVQEYFREGHMLGAHLETYGKTWRVWPALP